MRVLTSVVLLVSFALHTAGQGFSKEDIKRFKIKKTFANGPNSKSYDIEEYDTSGNLLTVSKVYEGKPAFVTEELKYNSSMLIEKRKYERYSPDGFEINRYFYNGKGLLIREEDTIMCSLCKIPKRIKQYEYNDSSQLIFAKYQSGNFHTLQKQYYNDKGLLMKIEASSGKEKDFVHFYFYNGRKDLIKDSVYNFMSKGSLRNYYKYEANGRLTETKNMDGRTVCCRTVFFYNDEGLLYRIITKQRGGESKKYYISETYFNFERY